MVEQRREAFLHSPLGMEIASNEPQADENDDDADDGPFDYSSGRGVSPVIIAVIVPAVIDISLD